MAESNTAPTGEGRPWKRGPLAWMAENSVAANLVMIVLIFGGLVMLPGVKQEVFPEVDLDTVSVNVPYPGATPAEVEHGVVLAVEEAIQGIDGVEEIRSVASEGQARITAELFLGTDKDRALNDIKNAVDRITSFPEDVERPVFSVGSNRREVISVIIYGDHDRKSLKQMAEQARSELLTDERITMVQIEGLPPPEISIEIPQANLRRYGLTIDEISRVVNRSTVEIPSGSVDTPKGEVLLRTTERRDEGEEFRNLPVISRPDGAEVPLRKLGHVVDGFRDVDREAYFNGRNAVRLRVFRLGEQTPLDVSDAVHQFVEAQRQEWPSEVKLAIWNDFSEIYNQRVGLLLKNGFLGLLLVLAILGSFLHLRLAFWVAMGIAISFVGVFLFVPALGVSINMISLFAFLLAIGIVVDDAIVVGEAIHKHRSDGKPPLRSAIDGVREVATPVVFSVLTTVIAFTPMLFVPGVTGKFFLNIPLIVIPILLLSLIESFFVLPAHLAHHGDTTTTNRIAMWVNNRQERFSAMIQRFIERQYAPFARSLLAHRYITLTLALALLVLTAGFVAGGRIGFNFLPKIEGDIVRASAELPFGAPADETRAVMRKLVKEGRDILGEYGGERHVDRGILAQLGELGAGEVNARGGRNATGSHLASVAISLVPPSERDFGASEFAKKWRQRVGELPGVERLSFSFNLGVQAGAKVAIELSHRDRKKLHAAASQLAETLGTYDGVFDIDDGFQRGKEQLDLQLKPAGRSLGLTEQGLARQVRGAFFGSEAERQQRGRDELRIYVRRPEKERNSEYFVENLIIQTPGGGEMPLRQAAVVQRESSFTQIEREQGRRMVDVTADVNPEVITGGEVTGNVVEEVLPQLMKDFPGLSYELSGEQQQQAEAMSSLRRGLVLAVFAIFAIIAVSFGSYLQPLLIMAAIPFGIVGAIAGHFIMGYNLSFISVFGMVALSGVVVNDSLVLITVINEHYRNGEPLLVSITQGCVRRFRPILLTSLTTFFGLLPMIFETSVQARFLIPMAISLGFGVLFVTVITLIIVPAAYAVMEDLRGLVSKPREKPQTAPH